MCVATEDATFHYIVEIRVKKKRYDFCNNPNKNQVEQIQKHINCIKSTVDIFLQFQRPNSNPTHSRRYFLIFV